MQERDDRDDRHQDPSPGQPVRPADRGHRQLGEQHARDEPRQECGRPVQRADTDGGGNRDQRPAEAHDTGGCEHRYPGPHRHPPHQQREHRQRDVEAHLDGQAPHLRQPGGQRQRHIDLGQRQVGQPDRQIGLGVGKQGQDDDDRHQVRGHDADQARPQIVSRRRYRTQVTGGGGVATPQQETRQREEHRDGQVEPAEKPSRHPAGVPGLEGDVGDDDADGRAGAHSLHRGQEATGTCYTLRLPFERRHSDQCAGRGSRRSKRGP